MAKRIRLLIYESPDSAQLDRQLSNGLFGRTTGTKALPPGPYRSANQMTVTAIDLDPRRITLLEILRVLRREFPLGRRKSLDEAQLDGERLAELIDARNLAKGVSRG